MTRGSKRDQREPKDTIATSNPVGATHHEGAGYSIGSRWINSTTKKIFICMDATNPADWDELGLAETETFLALNDTPGSYGAGEGGWLVVQNGDDDGVEIIENTPAAVGILDGVNLKHTYDATNPPDGATHHSGAGYSVGSRWIDLSTDKEYVCVKEEATAIWMETTGTSNFTSLLDTPANYTNKEYDLLRVASTADQVEFLKCHQDTDDPVGASHHVGTGYKIGSRWINTYTFDEFVCLDETDGAGQWKKTTAASYSEFKSLSDTPNDYAGMAYRSLRVKGTVDGIEFQRHNVIGSARPVATNDGPTEQYSVGSLWCDLTNDEAYICVDPTDDAAVWRRISTPFSKYDATAPPDGDNDLDEGFEVGSTWLDTTNKKEYVCYDPADGVADWVERGAGSGGGGSGHNTIYADTYEVTETEETEQVKKQFDYVNDSDAAAVSLKLICTLWMTGGGTATCKLEATDGTTTVDNTVTATESAETVKKITLAIGTLNTNDVITVKIYLHKTGGTTAHLKYSEVRELFS